MYVFNLPLQTRRQLCETLDQSNKWQELAESMNYGMDIIISIEQNCIQGISPAEELLTLWGHKCHTVFELFIHLSKIHHYLAMEMIKQHVQPRYHFLITDAEQNVQATNKNLQN